MPLFPSTLSRGSRPIGPIYNDTKRSSRKLSRQGFDREAGQLALLAEQQKLAGGGSNITSAEGNRDERDAIEVAQSGLSRERRDAVLKGNAKEAGLTVEASGAQLTARKGLYERMRGGVTPEMKSEATSLGITDSGFAQASASAGQNRLTRPGAAPVASPVAGAAAAPAADNSYFTDKPFEFAAKEAGEPARRLAMRAAEDKLTSTPQFGAGPANQNIAKLGLDGAIADYKNRSKAYDERGASPAPAGPVGPLQQALLEARARRETRAADASEAADITAGLNAAPTPRLDTSFPVAAASVPLSAPSATLNRPAPPRGGRRGAASDYMKTYAVSLQAERLKREKEEAEKSRTTRAAQIASTRTLGRGTSRSY